MREIEFRGKRKDAGNWVYGDLLVNSIESNNIYSKVSKNECYQPYDMKVDPDTIGQLSGVKDKNGIKIFEGDIILWRHTESSGIKCAEKNIVLFENGCFVTKQIDSFYPSGLEPNGRSLYVQCRLYDAVKQKHP